MLDLEQGSYKWLWGFLLSFDLGSPGILQGYDNTCQECGGTQWHMESTGHTVRVQLSPPVLNASWLAHRTKQKKEALFFFFQTAGHPDITNRTLYKQCWLISATADVYAMWPARSSVTLDPWPWNNGIVFFISLVWGDHIGAKWQFKQLIALVDFSYHLVTTM